MLFLIDADTLDGVLLQLHNGESEPFRQEPYMICKACGHRWGALLPPALCLTNTERPYRPAKVVRVHREVGNSIMRLPIFGETRRPNRWRRHCTVKTSGTPPCASGFGVVSPCPVRHEALLGVSRRVRRSGLHVCCGANTARLGAGSRGPPPTRGGPPSQRGRTSSQHRTPVWPQTNSRVTSRQRIFFGCDQHQCPRGSPISCSRKCHKINTRQIHYIVSKRRNA